MRLLFTSILGLLFVAAFFAFFLLRSVSGYVESPDRMLASAESLDLRSEVVNASASYIADKVAADPALKEMSVEQLQLIIGGVVTEEWFNSTLRAVHGELREAIHGAEKNAVLNLRNIKASLKTALSKMKAQALENCQRLLSAELCKDAEHSSIMIAAFEAQANAAIDQIEDEVSLLGDLEGEQLKNAKNLSDAFEGVETVRMGALLLLILSLAGIIILNNRPLSRMLGVTGAVALIASGLYLLTIAVSNRLASEELSSQLGRLSDEKMGGLSTEWVGKMAGDLIAGSTMPVSMIGVAGVLAILASILFARRA
ncbi:MAG: hypothetical protein JKY56_27405 [Kofleriaceae bacterium]|nr:hypothetical protein [Kofleriaceae bacterium]